MFIRNLWENPRFFFSWMLFVVFSVSLHEFVHAYMALREGDDTAAKYGHLTLNPFKQMGIVSLFMLIFLGFCWGAVPVDPRNFRRKYSNFIVSLSGPFTNLCLFVLFAVISGIALRFFPGYKDSERLQFFIEMFFNGAIMNMVLFIFNMLPVAGFDGYVLVENFVPQQFKQTEFFKGATLVVLLMAFFFSNYIFMIGKYATYMVIKFIFRM